MPEPRKPWKKRKFNAPAAPEPEVPPTTQPRPGAVYQIPTDLSRTPPKDTYFLVAYENKQETSRRSLHQNGIILGNDPQSEEGNYVHSSEGTRVFAQHCALYYGKNERWHFVPLNGMTTVFPVSHVKGEPEDPALKPKLFRGGDPTVLFTRDYRCLKLGDAENLRWYLEGPWDLPENQLPADRFQQRTRSPRRRNRQRENSRKREGRNRRR